MSRRATRLQTRAMSRMFRGTEIFKPLNTGRIDGRVSCVREWAVNVYFYTKNGVTLMIDAGYHYERLREKMGWLDLDPAQIRHILITHQDTDHMGAVEEDGGGLFQDAWLYIGEIENRYLTGEVRRRVGFGTWKLPMVRSSNPRMLLRDGEAIDIGGIRVECLLTPGHTWGHMAYLIDDAYLFTGDALWFGADGGYSFVSTLAEDNRLAVRSLWKLERTLRERDLRPKIITGHTGWTDDLDWAFAHRDRLCAPFAKRVHDPAAPYDSYDEAEDTEERARNEPLPRRNIP